MNECPIHRDTPYNTYRRCTHIERRHVSESVSTTRQTVWIAYFEDDEAGRPRCHTGGVIFTGDRVKADRVWDRCVAAMRADLPPDNLGDYYVDLLDGRSALANPAGEGEA